jgi:hypothetical protein
MFDFLFKKKLKPSDANVTYSRYADIPAEKVLEGAMKANLESVSIVGWDKDGNLYMASTYARKGSTYWDLGLFQKELM